jgi:NADH:ubiquinone oxidoreductase subunit 6 (subunit J)
LINNPVIFYIASIILIVSVSATLFAKDIIRSLLSSIVVFFIVALLFYVLGSEYNAIIQASVYGFAVPIIIGISIMFTNSEKDNRKSFVIPYITLLCAGFFASAVIAIILLPDSFDIYEAVQVNSFDVISAFAKGIFINYVWAFELVSVLLTIVIAGLAMFRRRNS